MAIVGKRQQHSMVATGAIKARGVRKVNGSLSPNGEREPARFD